MQQEKFNSHERSISLIVGALEVMTKSSPIGKKLWGNLVEISTKMDGENTTLCADGTAHARSLDSKKRLSRDALTSTWKTKGRYALPDGWRIVVENKDSYPQY